MQQHEPALFLVVVPIARAGVGADAGLALTSAPHCAQNFSLPVN